MPIVNRYAAKIEHCSEALKAHGLAHFFNNRGGSLTRLCRACLKNIFKRVRIALESVAPLLKRIEKPSVCGKKLLLRLPVTVTAGAECACHLSDFLLRRKKKQD